MPLRANNFVLKAFRACACHHQVPHNSRIMNQPSPLFALTIGLPLLVTSCSWPPPQCPDLTGRWTNRDGKIFVFQPDSNALWLTKFGSQYDTVVLDYQYRCDRKKNMLDLKGFSSGPLVGRSLYAFIEWNGDTAFLFDAAPEVRPQLINLEQAERYVRTSD